MRRRASLALTALALVWALTGCHYIHFGRPEKFRTDRQLATENSDLRMEKKLLQEELAIARKEGEVLRSAMARPTGASAATDELATKLRTTARELADLRAEYARLQAQRESAPARRAPRDSTEAKIAAAEQVAELRSKLGETEDKLADALRTLTQLRSENQQLQASVEETRAENATLAQKLDRATAEAMETRSALTQLNTEFLAQKEARAQAEQAAEALRAQLHAMASAAKSDEAPSLASARETTAGGAHEIESTLQSAGLANDTPATAMLSTSPAKLRAREAASHAAAPESAAVPAPAAATRTYVVQEGDTLEKIAQKVYGRPDKWSAVYEANADLLRDGRPLAAGTELQIPAP